MLFDRLKINPFVIFREIKLLQIIILILSLVSSMVVYLKKKKVQEQHFMTVHDCIFFFLEDSNGWESFNIERCSFCRYSAQFQIFELG